MTCAEFRKKNVTDQAMIALTRGERAVCCHHYENCIECRQWTRNQPLTIVVDRDVINKIISDDFNDPEFRSIVCRRP